MTSPRILRFPRMTALAAGLAMAFLGPDSVLAAPAVTNCNDSGAGSLRNAVVNATNGDTILLSGSCTPITLTSAIAIPVGVNDLTLNGPGANALEISGGQVGRVFTHNGTGTLSITGVSITNGVVNVTNGDAKGGCIASAGNVHLTGSVVSGCFAVANTSGNNALGGGVYAAGDVVLTQSTVSGNTTEATTTMNQSSYGGGVFARGGFSAESSTLSNNESDPITSSRSEGGGVYIASGAVVITNSTISGNRVGNDGGGVYINTTSGVNISNSTISGNQAGDDGGGLYIISASTVNISNSTISGNQAGDDGGGLLIGNSSGVTISNSTISGNQSASYGGGLFSYGALTVSNSTISGNRAIYSGGLFSYGALTISNSTIAFNSSDTAQTSQHLAAAGVDIVGATLTLNSTIIANNRAAGEASDLSNRNSNGTMRATVFAGSHNLIYAKNFDLKVPMDTLSACPRLQRLAPHGGPTQTVALRSGSFAIDFGSVLNALTTDQRGFPRVVNNVADIGAYERQVNEQDDALFFSGFESGCDE